MTTLSSDNIQSNADPMNTYFFTFGVGCEHPIDTTVTPSDANGANLSRVANPDQTGYAAALSWCMRHYGDFDAGGARAQCGNSTSLPAAFGTAVLSSPFEVYLAHLMYLPSALSAGDWLSIQDFHVTDAGGGNRWDTMPGIFINPNGGMAIQYSWHGDGLISDSGYSATPLPVGSWFWLETYYKWVTSGSPFTMRTRLNGTEILSQASVHTRSGVHTRAEAYVKFYGQGTVQPWSPNPSLKYVAAVEFNDAWKVFSSTEKRGFIRSGGTIARVRHSG